MVGDVQIWGGEVVQVAPDLAEAPADLIDQEIIDAQGLTLLPGVLIRKSTAASQG